MKRLLLTLLVLMSACLQVNPPEPGPEEPDIFSLDKVHQIDLEIDPALFAQLDADPENRVPANITFDGFRLENIGIRRKCGLSSCSSINDKTGFSIKFDEFEEQRLSGKKKLILNNEVQDLSYSNKLVGNHIARLAGIPTPEIAYAFVTLNSQPYGFFVMAESIDKQFLKKHFGDGNEEGNLYEGPCCADFVDNIFFPELKDEIEDGRSRDDLQAFSDFISFSDNEQFEAEIEDFLDVETYITQYAISALTAHIDNYEYNTNNYYNYHNPVNDKFTFWLHGMDFLFFDCNFSIDTFPNGRLGQRVFSTPALREQFHQEIEGILDTIWNDDLLTFLDNARAVYEAEARQDPTRPFDDLLFEITRQCIVDRPAIVRAQLNVICGDGILNGGEQCDDGNTNPNDGCSPVCISECGDGSVSPNEECDDGNSFPGDGCGSDCRLEPPQCGDGVVAGTEECDDFRNGDNSSDGCRDDCSANRCGDGLLDLNEECDDSNNTSGDGCSAACSDEDGLSECGNGLLEVGEVCDDGNANNNDSCDDSCLRICEGGDNRAFAAFNNHCYVSFEFGVPWQDAQNICQQAGGHLATLSSTTEEQLVNDLSFNDPWIGLNDIAQEEELVWVNGEALSFVHLASGVPSNFSPLLDCFNTTFFGWQDRSCDAPLSFVCELE